eukprot:COSAG01_NODE_697_length_14188_cov_41.810348_3_plen_56_part_00
MRPQLFWRHVSADASKDFWDPVKQRRILWGWATGGPPKALPRELTYHPTLRSIVQ